MTLIMLCACILLLCACSAPADNSEQSRVSIWYIAGDVLVPRLKECCEQIQTENDNIIIELCPFESMELLYETLQGKRPDLLLCSHELAFSLEEQGMLKSLDIPGLDYRPELLAKYAGFGRSFFPIGAAVELLCSTNELRLAELSSFEALCSKLCESGKLMTADSFARVMSTALIQTDAELSTNRRENAANPDYRYIHNLLAEMAMQGSLAVFDQGGAEVLLQGRVEAAIISSAGASSLPDEITIMPVPVMEGGSKSCIADMRGFAYLGNTRDNSQATAFVLKKLLSQGGARELALSCGLVSAQLWEDENVEGKLQQALYEIYSQWEMILPSPVSPYVMARQQLEEELSAAINYLQ